MKAKIKFYLPNNLLQKQHPIEGRQEFEGECECAAFSLFQDAVGSLGGGVYEWDVRDLPDHGRTSQDNQIKRMWRQVEDVLCSAEAQAIHDWDDEEQERVADALKALDELREIYR